jgi:Ca2+-binding RTX toxin-like protein
MTSYTIAQDNSETLQIDDGDTVLVDTGVLIVDPSVELNTRTGLTDWAGIQDTDGGDNRLAVFGTVEGFVGTWLWEGSDTVSVGAGGEIYGFNAGAEFHDGGHDLLDVKAGGEVASTLYAVWFGAFPHYDYTTLPLSGFDTVDNAGLIEGVDREGIRMVFGGNHVVNSGTVMSHLGPAIMLDSGVDDPRNFVTNTGRLDGGSLGSAIVSGDAPMTVSNDGSIVGDVQFGAGDDRFTGSGTIAGTLYGGAGNDHLVGGAGATSFCGGAGADYLQAGSGVNTFIYNAPSDSTEGSGVDTIDGFDFAKDHIVIAGVTLASFDHIDALSQLQPGHAALIESAGGVWHLVVDANGISGYQAGADYMITLTHPLHLS